MKTCFRSIGFEAPGARVALPGLSALRGGQSAARSRLRRAAAGVLLATGGMGALGIALAQPFISATAAPVIKVIELTTPMTVMAFVCPCTLAPASLLVADLPAPAMRARA